jgi:hypothetical protein
MAEPPPEPWVLRAALRPATWALVPAALVTGDPVVADVAVGAVVTTATVPGVPLVTVTPGWVRVVGGALELGGVTDPPPEPPAGLVGWRPPDAGGPDAGGPINDATEE